MEEGIKVKKNIEMKVINTLKKALKEQIQEKNRLKIENDCPENVKKAIEAISSKMNQSKFS